MIMLAACGAPRPARPISAIQAYVHALQGGDYGRAYELMSERYRKEHTRDEFVKLMKESPADVRETASRLSAGKRQVNVQASYVYDDLKDELHLTQEGGSWRIDDDPLAFYPQETPRDTLRSFVRAVELKRYDVVLRFVPNEWRKDMTAQRLKEQMENDKKQEIDELLRKLHVAIDNPIEQNGEDARMEYGDHTTMKFHKEDGVWKIEEFE
jgi:hypothetical protein